MSFDKTPTTWLENWSEDGTDITVPIATFPELTAAEADAVTGDIRKIAFAILEKLFSAYNGTVEADRPIKWTMRKTASVDAVRNVIKSQYVVWFETEIGTQEVADESSSSATATSTSTATPTASSSSTSTATPTATSSSTASSTSTSTQSISGSDTASGTFSASVTSTRSATSTPTSTATITPTASSSRTLTSTATATATATH